MREIRLLVVDEDKGFCDLIGRELGRPDTRVLTARDAAEALGIAAKTALDVVLVDAQLPEMDGYELTQELRRCERARGAFILLTTREKAADRFRGFACGADDYLVKPDDPLLLSERLRRLRDELQGRPPTAKRPPATRRTNGPRPGPGYVRASLREKLCLALGGEGPLWGVSLALLLLPCAGMSVVSLRSKALADAPARDARVGFIFRNPSMEFTSSEASVERALRKAAGSVTLPTRPSGRGAGVTELLPVP